VGIIGAYQGGMFLSNFKYDKRFDPKAAPFRSDPIDSRVAQEYFESSARKVESHTGWSRHSVSKGLKEVETGFVCLDNYSARGRKKTTEHLPMMEADIRNLVEDKTIVNLE